MQIKELLISVTFWVVLVMLVRRTLPGSKAKAVQAGSRSVVKWGLGVRILLLLVTGAIAAAAVKCWTDEPRIDAICCSVIAFVFAGLIPEIFTRRIEYDDHEIVIYCFWRKPQRIPWTEVVSFNLKPEGGEWILETRHQGKIVLLVFLEGLHDLHARAITHTKQGSVTKTVPIRNATIDIRNENRRKSGIIWLGMPLIPVICFIFIRTEWIARLTALSAFYASASICLLLWAINPRGSLKKKESQPRGNISWWIGEAIGKGLMLLTAFTCIYLASGLAMDCYGSFRFGHTYLEDYYGEVRRSSFNFGAYFFHQKLSVTVKGGTNYFFSADFFPRVIKDHHKYRFLVAPKGKHVLECVIADDVNVP